MPCKEPRERGWVTWSCAQVTPEDWLSHHCPRLIMFPWKMLG